jgi:two-component system, NarL family, response regulator, fimbrial Z protein, FimZ
MTPGAHVLIVDQDRASRNALRALLARLGAQLTCVKGPIQARTAAASQPPDLIVLDLDSGGLELCRELQDMYARPPKIMLLSARLVEPEHRVAGLLVGADDYLTKPYHPDELLVRCRHLLSSGTLLPAPLSASALPSTLTSREAQILAMLSSGRSQKEIAADLDISSKTVGTHLQNTLSKLGVHSRAHAVAIALHRPQPPANG